MTITRKSAPVSVRNASAPPRKVVSVKSTDPRARAAAQKGGTRAAPAVSKRAVAASPTGRAPTRGNAKVKAKATRVRAPLDITPVRAAMGKTELLQYITDQVGLENVTMRDMKKIYDVLEETILGSLAPKGAGEFVLPGIVKFFNVKKPATKGGKKGISPFTGEEYITKAKPATIKVKARVLAKVKRAATGQ